MSETGSGARAKRKRRRRATGQPGSGAEPRHLGGMVDGLSRDFILCGQNPEHDMQLGAGRVPVGSGGAAPMILEFETRQYRQSQLRDLYDADALQRSIKRDYSSA